MEQKTEVIGTYYAKIAICNSIEVDCEGNGEKLEKTEEKPTVTLCGEKVKKE